MRELNEPLTMTTSPACKAAQRGAMRSSARACQAPLREAVLLAAHGKVQREGEVVHLVVERVVDWSRELNALIEEPPLAQRPTIAAPQQKYPY